MNRVVLLLLLSAGLQACITIKPPKGLVSDSVEAGIDVYKTIKDEKAEDRDSGPPSIFASQYVADQGTDPTDVSNRCLDQAMEQAAHALNVQSVSATVLSENSRVEENSVIASCKIRVVAAQYARAE